LVQEHQKMNRYEMYHCSVMMIDVDLFKHINDTKGHQSGDQVLKQLAHVFQDSLRNTDIIGRWGGEEFMVILSHTQIAQALVVAENLRKTVEGHSFGIDASITISIGVGELMREESIHENISRIDAALYKAKNNGRNGVEHAN